MLYPCFCTLLAAFQAAPPAPGPRSKTSSQLPALPLRSSHAPPSSLQGWGGCLTPLLPRSLLLPGAQRDHLGPCPGRGEGRAVGGTGEAGTGEGCSGGGSSAFSPARSSQGLAWRMSHPLGTGNSGTPITPTWGGLQKRGRGLQSPSDLNKTPFKGKKGI